MLSRLPISLLQLKAENNSEKLKTKIGNYYILCTDQKTCETTLQKFGRHYLKMETIFMNSENIKTSEAHKFKFNLIDKLNR